MGNQQGKQTPEELQETATSKRITAELASSKNDNMAFAIAGLDGSGKETIMSTLHQLFHHNVDRMSGENYSFQQENHKINFLALGQSYRFIQRFIKESLDTSIGIIYVVSLSDFDQFLEDSVIDTKIISGPKFTRRASIAPDLNPSLIPAQQSPTEAGTTTINKLYASFQLLNKIINTPEIRANNYPIIIVFNKFDEFSAKIQRSPLHYFFPHYTGPDGDVEAAIKWISTQFTQFNQTSTTISTTTITTTSPMNVNTCITSKLLPSQQMPGYVTAHQHLGPILFGYAKNILVQQAITLSHIPE